MFLDLTVVYFAFGAPLGVYEITRNDRSPKTAALAAVHFLLWPFFAAVSVRRSYEVEVPAQTPEQKIDGLRGEFESAFLDGQSDANVLEFRDAFARYTGLAVALRKVDADVQNELFAIAGRADSSLATRCLDRRNRRRLEFHLVQAKNELDEVIAELVMTRHGVDELTRKLARFVEC